MDIYDIDYYTDGFPGEFVYGYMEPDYSDELWKELPYNPNYMISSYGRVWSTKSQKFLKPKRMDRTGHVGISIRNGGRVRYFYLHRLMAELFIPNPDNLPIVRHLDDIPNHNVIDNLAWGTQADNWKDCYENGHTHFVTDEEREIGFRKTRKPIMGTNLKTGERIEFRSQNDAARILGLQQSNIWKVLNGERPHCGGWFFEYLPKTVNAND